LRKRRQCGGDICFASDWQREGLDPEGRGGGLGRAQKQPSVGRSLRVIDDTDADHPRVYLLEQLHPLAANRGLETDEPRDVAAAGTRRPGAAPWCRALTGSSRPRRRPFGSAGESANRPRVRAKAQDASWPRPAKARATGRNRTLTPFARRSAGSADAPETPGCLGSGLASKPRPGRLAGRGGRFLRAPVASVV